MLHENKRALTLKARGKYFLKLGQVTEELNYLSFIKLIKQHSEIPKEHFFEVLSGKRIDFIILNLFKTEVKECALEQVATNNPQY